MGQAVLAVLAVSGVATMLALILVVAERFIARYGSCTIDINQGTRRITLEGGKSLLNVLTEEKLFIPSACGGRGTCGYCKVTIREGGGPVLPTETPFLTADEQKQGVRLSCQVKVRNDLVIEIPEELLSVREYTAVCDKIEDLTYDMKRFILRLQEPDHIDYVPGQYVQLLCPPYPGSDEEVYRAYSIASDPAETGRVDLIIRRVPNGICTTWCFEHLQEGQAVRINGPYGEFRLSDNPAPALFIAGGSGMAPFVSILHQMEHAHDTRPVRYFYGGNQVRDLCLLDEMKRFEEHLKDFTFIPVVAEPGPEEPWDGRRGLVTEAVSEEFDNLADYEAYLCGSPGMIDAAIKIVKSLGIDKARIYYDKFA